MLKRLKVLDQKKRMTGKRMINIAIAIALVFISCIQGPTEISAAKNQVSYMDFSWKPLHIEIGKKFHFGDLVEVHMRDNSAFWCASELKAKYSSDHPQVITIDKNGYARTKKPGKAVVTVKYQGKKVNCPVKVVKKGRFSSYISRKSAKKWEEAGKKLSKKVLVALTVENGYTMAKAIKTYINSLPNDIYDNYYGMIEGRMEAPSSICYQRAEYMMKRWVNQYHPYKYHANIIGISKTEDAILVEFIKKLSDKGLLALYFEDILEQTLGFDTSKAEIAMKIDKKHYVTYAYLKDEQGEQDYEAAVIFEKGSKIVTIKPMVAIRYADGLEQEITGDNLKLQAGHTYEISCYMLWGCETITI